MILSGFMKIIKTFWNKRLWIALCMSVLLIVVLSRCVVKLKYRMDVWEMERKRMETILTDAIQDEETAERLAYVLIEVNLGWEENCTYEAETTFDAQSHNWTVLFYGMTSEGNALPEADRTVVMKKESGEVVELIDKWVLVE